MSVADDLLALLNPQQMKTAQRDEGTPASYMIQQALQMLMGQGGMLPLGMPVPNEELNTQTFENGQPALNNPSPYFDEFDEGGKVTG